MANNIGPKGEANNKEPEPTKQAEVLQLQHTEYRGPLPPPVHFKQYDDIVPGAAERILTMAEKEGDHRRKQEDRVVRGGAWDKRLGLIFAFIVAVAGLVIAGFTTLQGHGTFGGFLGISVLGSMVGAFIYGSRKKDAQPKGEG